MLTVTQTFAGITAGAGATVAVIFVQATHRARSLADSFSNTDAKEAATGVLAPYARAVGENGLGENGLYVVAAAIFGGLVLVAYYLKPQPPPQVTLPPTSTPLPRRPPLAHHPRPSTTIPSPKSWIPLPRRGSPLPHDPRVPR